MKNLVMNAVALLAMPLSAIVQADEKRSVYCDATFSEYQHNIIVDDVIGLAKHRQGFLQIEKNSDDRELKKILVGQSKLGLDRSRCRTWINNQNKHQNDGTVARLHFGFDQSNLTAMGRDALSQLAESLKNEDSAIAIEGHTDNKGSEGYNQALGLRRALAASGALLTEGVDANRIVVRSYGENLPIATNSTEEGRAQNRRSEIKTSERNSTLSPE